ncbi:hypothetical protein GQX74_007781 [Glossina fuscipes]|nr:hypothetical protein GQX74_007781 [Glossina fuscipes]
MNEPILHTEGIAFSLFAIVEFFAYENIYNIKFLYHKLCFFQIIKIRRTDEKFVSLKLIKDYDYKANNKFSILSNAGSASYKYFLKTRKYFFNEHEIIQFKIKIHMFVL